MNKHKLKKIHTNAINAIGIEQSNQNKLQTVIDNKCSDEELKTSLIEELNCIERLCIDSMFSDEEGESELALNILALIDCGIAE